MNRQTKLTILIAIGIILAGCGASTKEIARMSQSERIGVFAEISSPGTVPAGFADILIKASLKTPFEGYYLRESRESVDGKPEYAFLINVDGQAALWSVAGRQDRLPKYVDGKSSRDPEAGDGMKYMLEKRIRLAAGDHKVFFGLPGERYYTTADISVKSGGAYVLEFKPEYRYKTLPTRIPTFLKGIEKFEVLFEQIMVQDR